MELKSGFSVGVAHSLRLSVTSAEYFCRRHGSPGGGSQVLRGRWVRWSKFLSSWSKFFGVGGYAVPISLGHKFFGVVGYAVPISLGHKFFGVVGCAGPMVGYQNRRVSVYAKMQIRKCVLLTLVKKRNPVPNGSERFWGRFLLSHLILNRSR